ncbi:SAFB-like transcription modulator isoform X1 [Xenopus laevis]|uniref:SAFB-like transcription modulator n=1 Tax=Xenopus laevis TaxID=8355 RepID=A0A8J0UUY6_XENLA|nr:SAFB-like transcription modulator isoform X1 [Xenopus laevis]
MRHVTRRHLGVESSHLNMASSDTTTERKKLADLRVIDLKTELKRRSLDVNGVKNVLMSRLKQAIEEEGGDPDNIELTVNSDTPKKNSKNKGRKVEADESGCEASVEEDSGKDNELESQDVSDQDGNDELKDSEENEEESATFVNVLSAEEENETKQTSHFDNPERGSDIQAEEAEEDEKKDVTGSGDVTQEISKPLHSGDNESELRIKEEMETSTSLKEAEDDNVSVTIQAEDAITLDCDGDDLLETGKNVKIADSETSKPKDEQEASYPKDGLEDQKDLTSENQKDDKEESGKGDAVKKDGREASKKTESGDKDKDSQKKGASSTGASGQAKSSSKDAKESKSASKEDKGSTSSTSGSSTRNLWVSGLSSNTKAADLKNLFGKYGKVLSAKVVTNARSPGAKCYGIVTMSSSADVARCISHLHRTELHGQQISVEKVKNDPSKRDIKDGDEKLGSGRTSGERKSSGGDKNSKTQSSVKKDDRRSSDKAEKKDGKELKKDSKEKSESATTVPSPESSKKNEERKKPGGKSPGPMVVIDQTKGDQVYGRPPIRRGRFDKMRNREPFFQNKMKFREFRDRKDILTFEKMKQQRIREKVERMERIQRFRRAVEMRSREMAERECRERERIRIMREREELDRLQRERERLEIERQKLERERMERERLERERIRIEQERRREAERIAREREELRRQQEQLRFEQEKRNSLKRPRDVDHRRDEPFWNENKKMAVDTDSRFSHGSDFNRQQNRFNDFDHRDRNRYSEGSNVSSFERRDRFVSPGEGKKGRPTMENFNKNFTDSRRNEPAQPRNDPRDTDRREVRDQDDRRPVGIERTGGNRNDGASHDRGRLGNPEIQHGRQRDSGNNQARSGTWKGEGGISADKREARGERTDRPTRESTGQPSRGGHASRGGKPGYTSRDGDRSVIVGERGSSGQHFNEGRQVVERHGRDAGGPRKDWHAPSSQGSGYNARRMSDGRSGGMMSSNPAINRVVQMPGGSMQRGSGSGFKSYKGAPQRRY